MSIPDPQHEPTISVQRAGALVGLAKDASYAAVKRGEIPSLRFGHKLVVPTAKLLDMLGLNNNREETSEVNGDG